MGNSIDFNPDPQVLSQPDADNRYRQLSLSQLFTSTIKVIARSSGPLSVASASSGNTGLEVRAENSTSGAFIHLNRQDIYHLHIGLDSSNQLVIGGGTLGIASYRVFHEGNPVTGRASLPPATVGGGSATIGFNSTTGAFELCNFPGSGTGGDAFSFFRLGGNAGGVPTVSQKIARIDPTGAYAQISDKRVKSSFASAPGLEVLLKLNPLAYKHWEIVENDNKGKLKLGENFWLKLGFIAQDVAKVLPQAVTVPTSDQELHTLDYNCLLTVAIQAIKDQQQQIEELRAQVETLLKAQAKSNP